MLPFFRGALRWLQPLAVGCALVWAATLTTPSVWAQESACTDCHDLDPAAFEKTVHGSLSCTDCHTGTAPDLKKGLPHEGDPAKVDCATCHEDAVNHLKASVHGKPVFTQISGKPACQTCHGPIHELMSRDDPSSSIHPGQIAITCAQCHASPKIAKQAGVHLIQPLAAYQASVHARAVAEGKKAAECSSCHGSHDIKPASDPTSRVNHQKIPETCATCHADIAKAYEASVHGQAAARGLREAPVCTDCHGEHRILAPTEAGSPVSASNLPKLTCGRCHGDLRVTEKFGMPATSVSSFEDSYHGLAGRTGNETVANCASCHGVHDILPSSDPRSHVNKANLAQTCGACHPGAGTRFAIGPVHVVNTQSRHAAVFWIRKIYLWIIWLTIGGMVLHNLLDFRRKLVHPIARPLIPVKERRVRMSKGFRIAHVLMMVSFLVLAWTGFALKYPDGWWAAPLLAWEATVPLRSWIHRTAAIVMLASLAFHAVHVMIDRRARACIKKMLPNMADVHEFRERLRWFFGLRQDLPHSPALGYPEKAEYLALIWGSLVMAATGFLLWFENLTLHWLPKWSADVATTIHFYEAVLASLAILVWHFYFVLFDPLVYPMDTAWLTGREAPGRSLERTESVVPLPPQPVKPVKPEPKPKAEGEEPAPA
jgi:cytochrome b subunit of formate dehydrogenase